MIHQEKYTASGLTVEIHLLGGGGKKQNDGEDSERWGKMAEDQEASKMGRFVINRFDKRSMWCRTIQGKRAKKVGFARQH